MTPAEARLLLSRARCLHDERQVSEALDRQAREITASLGEADPLLLAVMSGGMWPTVELSRRLGFPHQVDYLHASRYGGARQGGELRWRVSPRMALTGRDVLVVDDILDEGHTLAAVLAACREAGARSVRSAVLVVKRHARRLAGIEADFHAVEVEDEYIFGCGMDVDEYWRGLPAIYAVASVDER
jgi:hypoxanthine phosphoribosyltransferase